MTPPEDTSGETGVAAGMSLGEAATRAAEQWEPFTQNHDPSFWRALRQAYASGYMRGFNACSDRMRSAITHATEQECECGGTPYDDPDACPACKVYHRLLYPQNTEISGA